MLRLRSEARLAPLTTPLSMTTVHTRMKLCTELICHAERSREDGTSSLRSRSIPTSTLHRSMILTSRCADCTKLIQYDCQNASCAGVNLCGPKSARLVVPFPVLLGTRYSVLFSRAGHLYAARVRRVARDAFVQRFGNLLAVSVAAQLLFVRRAADE